MAVNTKNQKNKPTTERVRKPRESRKTSDEAARQAEMTDTSIQAANEAEKNLRAAEDEQKLFSAKEVKRMVELEVAKREEAMRAQIAPIVVKMSTPENERVLFLWQAPVADYNVLLIGENGIYGRVTGKTDTFWVPKSELSRVLNEQVRNFIKSRWLMVLSGLTEEEREALGCNYADGEILSREAFRKMLDMGDELTEIFPGLCESHKQIVAQFFNEAYDAGDARVTRELVVKLNAISKQEAQATYNEEDPRRKGLFTPLIEKMNQQDAKD